MGPAAVNGDARAHRRYAAPMTVTELPPARPLQERLGGSARVDLKELRILGVAMLGAAAIRPLVPFEFVPPCPLRTITGIPCPMCGMTRGVTALVHGDFARALLMNPASYVAVALALLLLVQWRTRRVVIPVWVIVTALAGMWAWQLFKYATGRPL
jgi:uncharacterized protein DUF2752